MTGPAAVRSESPEGIRREQLGEEGPDVAGARRMPRMGLKEGPFVRQFDRGRGVDRNHRATRGHRFMGRGTVRMGDEQMCPRDFVGPRSHVSQCAATHQSALKFLLREGAKVVVEAAKNVYVNVNASGKRTNDIA